MSLSVIYIKNVDVRNKPKRNEKKRYCRVTGWELNPYNHNNVTLFHFYQMRERADELLFETGKRTIKKLFKDSKIKKEFKDFKYY
jgi:hypothetical protein